MRSSLSRRVCRQLVASHGFTSPACALSAPGHTSLSLRPTRPRHGSLTHLSRRTFMNMWKKEPREVKQAGFEPGFTTFVDFRAHSVEGTRLPSDEELVQAFRAFFDSKLTHRRAVNSSEAFVARLVLEHLQSIKTEELALTHQDLQKALGAIATPRSKGISRDHSEIATILYDGIKATRTGSKNLRPEEDARQEINSADLELYITALTRFGGSRKASQVLSSLQGFMRHSKLIQSDKLSRLHMLVLRGIATERQESPEIYAKQLEDLGFEYTSEFHEIMTTFFAETESDADGQLHEWFKRPIVGGKMARPESYMSLIRFSFRTSCQPDWLQVAMQDLCDSNPPKLWWDVVLKWAVYQGKDINHIRHMIDVIVQLNPGNEYVRADIFTINGLIEAAVETKNALLAERANALASEMDLKPNVRTFALLLEARMIGHDRTGAASAFEDLIHCGRLQSGSKNVDTVNLYLRHLCDADSTDSRRIVDVLGLVESQQGELKPDTVVALCLRFLRDDKTMEVVDTLGLHLKTFSMDERRIVREAFSRYCLDKAVSTARAWDGYSLMRQFFPETSRHERVQLMEGFFGRKRADMASHIFGHMRAHPDESIRPDLDAYVLCLEGLGAVPDAESLGMIHNMFKMDTMIQPNVRLFNAFIIAYTGCDEPRRAFDFWQQISNLPEGPTYTSLELAFRACQKMPFGYDRAKVIWEKMQRLEVEIPERVYDAYMLMLAGQGQLDQVQDMLLSKAVEYSSKLTPRLTRLAYIFNAIPFPHFQQAYKDWASLEFPDKWERINKYKMTKTVEGTDRISIAAERLKA
ncbi:hypothetical protein M406DRAFT_296350 [Cryphonectria parasitica EP155]|uniref:Complex I intermediate-associated protein 84 n=1 Tax=Cryphonectria parasitica (strain ATCC 38755 / EP155) TaxID=660469 RepID=A0A9P4XU14_CRYP1|nr:uncharacterized protein M406DRAFT_296350 [Cryphonectria parasitica EP155]KAF3760876.1 hypothetical protein M406DRAFT_296350 [Cryphonectria parasitica EP155]